MKKKEQSVREKIQGAFDTTQKIQKGNKTITNVWFSFYDCDLEEMREYGSITFSVALSRMRLYASDSNATVFCFSQKVKVKNHIVIDTVIKNK